MSGSFIDFLLGNEADFIGKEGSCQKDATAVPILRNRTIMGSFPTIFLLGGLDNGTF